MRKVWILLVFGCTLVAASERPGAVFLMIWPGARATALSGAFSAIADDATACYYNQAGLAFINNTIVSLQHAPWLAGLWHDMYYEYAGVTKSYKPGTFGLDIIYLTTGTTDVIDSQGQHHGTYTTFDIAVGLNYGFKLKPNLGLGVGWKFIYSYLVPDWVFTEMPELGIEKGGTGVTYAFDAGVLYKPFSFLSVASALQNIGPNISYTESGASDPLPYTLRLGARFEPINSKILKIGLSLEITKILVGMFADENKSFFENFQYELDESWKSIGLEVDYYDFVRLRFGLFRDKEGQRVGNFLNTGFAPTFGGGIKAGGFSLDIGVDENIYDFDTANRKFSLSYQF